MHCFFRYGFYRDGVRVLGERFPPHSFPFYVFWLGSRQYFCFDGSDGFALLALPKEWLVATGSCGHGRLCWLVMSQFPCIGYLSIQVLFVRCSWLIVLVGVRFVHNCVCLSGLFRHNGAY